MKNRLLSLILTVVMFAALVPKTVYGVRAEGETEDYLGMMSALEIVEWNDDGIVTRADFVRIVVGIMTGSNVDGLYPSGHSYFKDIDNGMNCYASVMAAADLGLISRKSDMFYPENRITYYQAAKILVNALGRGMMAESKGGWPLGYIREAKNAGLKSIRSGDIPMTRKLCAELLESMLTSAPTSVIVIKGSKMEMVTYDNGGKCFMEQYLGKTYTDGVVDATAYTSLTQKEGLGKGRIRIDGYEFKCGNEEYARYIGQEVRAYIDTDKESVLWIDASHSTSDIEEITAEAYDHVENQTVYYESGSGKLRTLTIDGSAPVIINNSLMESYDDTDFDLTYGSIKLIRNSDGRNVVVVTKYENWFVLGVDSGKMIVTDRYNGGRKLIFKENAAEFVTVINASGVRADFSDIKANTVLTAAVSDDGKYIECYISEEKVSGGVYTINKSGRNMICGVGDTEYKFARYFDKTALNSITTGMNGTFYLDIHGNIAGFISEAYTSEYAYLIGASVKEKGFDTGLRIKLLTASGDVTVFDAARSFRIDGVKPAGSGVPTVLSSPQLVRYKLNSGDEVLYIDTVNKGAGDYFDTIEAVGSFQSSRYYPGGKTFANGACMSDNAIIFFTPDDNLNAEDDDYYTALGAELVTGLYNMCPYISEADMYIPDAYVIKLSTNGEIQSSSEYGVVCGMETRLSENGETKQMVQLLDHTQEKALAVKDDSIAKSLETGDIIRYETNNRGELIAMEFVYDRSVGSVNTSGSFNGYSFDSSFRVDAGYLYTREGKVLGISKEDGVIASKSDLKFITLGNNVPVYFVENWRDNESRVNLKLYTDLLDKVHNADSSRVVVITKSIIPRMVIAYE